jgi:hypothetical protein
MGGFKMIGMRENLIEMLGVTFANRQTEATARADMIPEYVAAREKYDAALLKLEALDKNTASELDETGVNMLNYAVAEAYFLGLQDGASIAWLLGQETPFAVIEREAVNKVTATIPQNKPFHLRPFALRSTTGEYRI